MRPVRILLICGFSFDSMGLSALRSSSLQNFRQPSVVLALRAASAKRNEASDDSSFSNDPMKNDNKEREEQSAPRQRTKANEAAILGYAIDSFLRGDYNQDIPEDGEGLPSPDLAPGSWRSATASGPPERASSSLRRWVPISAAGPSPSP